MNVKAIYAANMVTFWAIHDEIQRRAQPLTELQKLRIRLAEIEAQIETRRHIPYKPKRLMGRLGEQRSCCLKLIGELTMGRAGSFKP